MVEVAGAYRSSKHAGGPTTKHANLQLSRALLLSATQLRHPLVLVVRLMMEGCGLMFVGDQGAIAKDGRVVDIVKRPAHWSDTPVLETIQLLAQDSA